MLEIVHDLAPGADLYFATASRVGQAQFAANIEALCEAGADVIVDDIGYFTEGVFQDDIVAQGINAAVARGCIYFSAAGNAGNLNDGTSGVWEGDYTQGTFLSGVGYTHYFRGDFDLNRIVADGQAFTLKWADVLGASSNDYDLFLMNPTRSQILRASVDIQNGTQDPLEFISSGTNDDSGNWLLVIKTSGAADRYLHVNTHRGRLGVATAGQTYDHAAAANAIGVAATSVAAAGGAGGIFDGTESVEAFSSDGPRRIFFHPDGRAITPGNFSSTGGLLLQKPDVTAADRVSTATPGFATFPGTSAAAPHAAAIAALMLQAAGGPRSLTRAQLLQAMQGTALDIEAPGAWDRDSGAGIIDALAAVGAVRDPDSVPAPGGVPRAVHLTALRSSIDAARRNCGLANVVWTDPGIVSGVTPIKAVHITQPRAALNAAYQACGRTPPSWTDQIMPGTTPIKAVHFTELRNAVQALGGPPPPPPPGSTFGAGTWRVNSDIRPGRYFTNPTRGCYWERLSGLSGALSDIIANEFISFDSGQEIVDVRGSDLAFEVDAECGTWGPSPAGSLVAGTIPPGRWLVADQVQPGSYVASVQAGCYVEWLRGFGGELLVDVISNDFISSPGRYRLTIRDSHTGIYTDDDCGTWRSETGAALRGELPAVQDLLPATTIEAIEENRGRFDSTQPLR